MDVRSIINAHIGQVLLSPFITWGKDDCCLFAADLVIKLSGIDLAEPFRGKYSTPDGAAAVLADYAGGGLVQAAVKRAAELDLKEIETPGDGLAVAVCANRAGPLLGVWNGGGWLARTDSGCAVLPDYWMTIAWELPTCPQQ